MLQPFLRPRQTLGSCLPLLVMCLWIGLQSAHAASPATHADATAQRITPKPTLEASPKAGAASFTIEPAPTWVVPAREAAPTRAERAPLSYRVIDEQTRVDGAAAHAYHHVVRVINDSAGLGVGAQVEIEFDPSFQALAFHHFDVVRQGKHLNRLDRKKIRLLQRETQLERRMYDGRVTASFVVDDVRVGDEIDFAYSIKGSNPVFGGRYVSDDWMTSMRGPVALYQVRLIAPEARKIRYRLGSSDMQLSARVNNGWRDLVIRRDNVAQLRGDGYTPYSAVLRQMVQFAEFDDWADVARWGTALFSAAGTPDASLDQKAAEIRATSADPEQQVLAALRFVQTEVRYFGTEIGPNSHRPALPSKVLAQRYGDCKDKVTLLMALLQRLGVRATPLLVSTAARGQLGTLLPSALDFDHVIAQVELAGRTYDLDATRSHQSGPLARRGAVGFNQGLLLSSDTVALTPLSTAYEHERMSVRDTYTVADFSRGLTLESRITYRSDFAENAREALATRGAAELQSLLTMPYARLYPNLKTTAPMRVESSEQDDAVTLVLSFSLADPWRFPEERLLVFDMLHWSLLDALRVPNELSRTDGYAVGYVGRYRHTSIIEFAEDVFPVPGTQRTDDGDARVALHNTADTSARRSEFTSELQLRAEEIASTDWPGFVALVNKLAPQTSITVRVPAVDLPRLETLKKTLQKLDTSVRANELKLTTATQYQALMKSSVLTAQLEGGRLPDALRAQALTARGIQFDNLDRLDSARQDFELALELTPAAAPALQGAAVNAVLLRNYPRAVALTTQVLAQNPNDTEARHMRAIAHYFAQDYVAALADVTELLKDRTQVRRGYPLVWLSLITAQGRTGQTPMSPAYAPDQLPDDWPRPLVEWALGTRSAESVLASARQGNESAQRLCEAYYYIGERHLASGDNRRAREFFQRSVDQGIVEFIEHGAARSRLLSLER